jgi:hypothetical protein
VIELRAGTRIWIAAGVTDMRRGFQGLSAQVQTVLEQQPFSGHVFVFRGRRGDTIKDFMVRWRRSLQSPYRKPMNPRLNLARFAIHGIAGMARPS